MISTALSDLEKLCAELDGEDYQARVVSPRGRQPHLHVRNRRAGALTEDIYAGHGYFWFSWAERVAPVDSLSIAAEKIALVLRVEGVSR